MTYESITDVNLSIGFGEAINYVNNVSDSWFGYMLLIATYFIILFSLYRTEKDVPESMTVAGLVTFLFASLLWFGGLLDGISMLVITSVFIISFIFIWAMKNSV